MKNGWYNLSLRRKTHYANGEPHCDNGFAESLERNNGPIYYAWYKHGEFHRLDGPARVACETWGTWGTPRYIDEWYVDGKLVPVNSQEEFEQYLKLKAFW
jgi:hypothetical protein